MSHKIYSECGGRVVSQLVQELVPVPELRLRPHVQVSEAVLVLRPQLGEVNVSSTKTSSSLNDLDREIFYQNLS